MDDYGNDYQDYAWFMGCQAYGYSISTYGWFDAVTIDFCVFHGIDWAAVEV